MSLNSGYLSDIRRIIISRWVVQLVQLAYSSVGKDFPSDPIRAHETRAISSSLALVRGASVVAILKAASRKNACTFTDFYLRDLQSKRQDGSWGFKSLVLARDLSTL